MVETSFEYLSRTVIDLLNFQRIRSLYDPLTSQVLRLDITEGALRISTTYEPLRQPTSTESWQDHHPS